MRQVARSQGRSCSVSHQAFRKRSRLRSTAPANSPKQPSAESKPQGAGRTRGLWRRGLARRARECPRPQRPPPPITAQNPSFPHCGNIFSIAWKNRQKFFHCVEKSLKVFPLRGKNGPVFPQCGNIYSIEPLAQLRPKRPGWNPALQNTPPGLDSCHWRDDLRVVRVRFARSSIARKSFPYRGKPDGSRVRAAPSDLLQQA